MTAHTTIRTMRVLWIYALLSCLWLGRTLAWTASHLPQSFFSSRWLDSSLILIRTLNRSQWHLFSVLNATFAVFALVAFVLIRSLFGQFSNEEIKNVRDVAVQACLLQFIVTVALAEPDLSEYIVWTVWAVPVLSFKLICVVFRERFVRISNDTASAAGAGAHGGATVDSGTRKTVSRMRMLTMGCILFFIAAIAAVVHQFKAAASLAAVLVFIFPAAQAVCEAISLALKLRMFLSTNAAGYIDRESDAADDVFLLDSAGDLLCYSMLLAHVLHVWYLHGFQVSMFDLLLFFQFRSAGSEATKAFTNLQSHRAVTMAIRSRLTPVTDAELSAIDDACAICLEALNGSQASQCARLPCAHVFHRSCLRQWFKQRRNCPTCRVAVLPDEAAADQQREANRVRQQQQQQQQRGAFPAPPPPFGFPAGGNAPPQAPPAPPAPPSWFDWMPNIQTYHMGGATFVYGDNNAFNRPPAAAPAAAQPAQPAQHAPAPQASQAPPSRAASQPVAPSSSTSSTSVPEPPSEIETLVEMFPHVSRARLVYALHDQGSVDSAAEYILNEMADEQAPSSSHQDSTSSQAAALVNSSSADPVAVSAASESASPPSPQTAARLLREQTLAARRAYFQNHAQ